MGENTLTIEEKAKIKKEIDRLQFQREQIDLCYEIIKRISLIVFLLSIILALINFADEIGNSTLIVWHHTLMNHLWAQATLTAVLGIAVITLIIMMITNSRGENILFNKISKLYKIYDEKEGNFADYEKLKLEELKHQLKVIWYIWLPFIILTAISLIFSGQFGIKIESENYFLNYLTSICQNKSYQVVIAWTIFSPCIVLGFVFLFKDKAVYDFGKKLAQNAPPADIPGTGIQ